MLKLLFKKQLLETFAFFMTGGKHGADGKRRSPLFIVAIALLLIYGIGATVVMFSYLSWELCAAFSQNGLSQAYFALVATMSVAIALIVCAFMAKSKLFEAKDNDLLLAMPLPTWTILFARIIGLYAIALSFSSLVFIPACVVYFIQTGFSIVAAAFCLLAALVLPLLSLAISALVCWVLALIASRIRSKNLITTLLLVAFFTGYTLLYSKMGEAIEFILMHGNEISAAMQTWLFPFWLAGMACTGNALALLGTLGMFGGAFALVYLLLSRTFLSTVTTRRGGAGKKYKEKKTARKPAILALMKKELFCLKNPMILFNTALGSILFFVLIIFAFFNAKLVETINASGVDKGEVAVIVAVVLSFIAASNMITASSVSLEGENLWILKSSPVKTEDVFAAKLLLQITLTCIPATIAVITVCALLQIPLLSSVLVCLCVNAVACLCAVVGLISNLKLPNLTWTSEISAVKNSLSVVVAMFTGWGLAALLIAGYFTIGTLMSAELYLTFAFALYTSACGFLLVWLGTRGVKAFEKL
ncbi:MAG: hypothetical protein IJW60_05090 [Clostridia bacterium]|nr:hypothetical protein [Clostridia bacterium]